MLLYAEPQIYSLDIDVSLEFYQDFLGFQVVYCYGKPPFYAQVARDGVRINIRKVCILPMTEAFRQQEVDALALTITLGDPEPLRSEFEGKAIPFHQQLRTEPWGARTFIVRDPDGNLIAFAGPAALG